MIRRYLRGFLALALAVSLGVLLYRAYDGWRGARANEEALRTAGLDEVQKAERPETLPENAETLPEEAARLAETDLAALREVNGDIVGWLEIPGTGLSYPVAQGTDNQFYLSHNWKKEPSGGGAVFLEQTNGRDLEDFHLIVYGHRMRDGSMFGSLKHYGDPEYRRQHPDIYLVSEDGVRRYEIFAAYEAGVTGLVYRLDLEESGLEEEFLRSCLENSVIDTGVVPEAGDQVLTLSTCTGRGYGARWVVQGTLRGRYDMSGGS